MITGQIKSQVDAIWNLFANGGLTNALTVIEQFTYLLFLRRLDERQINEEKKANLLGQPLKNPIYGPGEADLRWHNFLNFGPEQKLEIFTRGIQVSNDPPEFLNAFDKMKTVGKAGGVFTEHMKGATFMVNKARLLDSLVMNINDITMSDRDTKGDLYEYMLSKIASAGRNGQFRTPRHIIRLMVDLTRPTKDDVICDPSCGTAGFLVSVGEYFHENHPDLFLDKNFRQRYNSEMFHGVEIDPSMLRIGAMNLQLHGIEDPQLLERDALSEQNADQRDKYTLLLANPPFKGSLDYDSVEASLLQTAKTKKTELLFLSLMLRMLQTGGRAAVIVPDGVLFGSSKAHKAIRSEIIEKHKLTAVISMPGGVFKPYAGVSTAVLFFTKTGTGGTDDVWFYDMQADGFSLDDKRQATEANDLPDIVTRFWARTQEQGRARTEQSFLVPKAEIVENDYDLSINRYKEIIYEAVEYDPPAAIIQRLKDMEQERFELLEELEKIMGE
ncbi:class I SAM-dependent DNA methyltransferase [Neolewinella persica]|uniref:class I SAM-dependent DNA methyltransferase n=1 Tax=Neolewinella persica TaxID=70998 RepID=UPI000381F7AF|nr:class I SAM-dependent DNA methyltransferase [Neolewinella persica]